MQPKKNPLRVKRSSSQVCKSLDVKPRTQQSHRKSRHSNDPVIEESPYKSESSDEVLQALSPQNPHLGGVYGQVQVKNKIHLKRGLSETSGLNLSEKLLHGVI